MTMTAFFFKQEIRPDEVRTSVRREIDADSRERCRKNIVLSSPLFKLGNEGFSRSIDDVGWDDVEDTARRYQGNRMH